MAQVLAVIPRAGLAAVLVAVELVLESGVISAEIIPLPNRIWRNVGWSLAASVLLTQAVVIANLMHTGTTVDAQINQASEYRAVPQTPVSYSFLEVYFKPDAKEVEIRKMLT